MKQKLMVAAVAGAFALPGVALAQVTISGNLSVGVEQTKIGNATARAPAGFNASSLEMASDAQIRFQMVEDLGNGLQFYGQYEFRPVLDAASGSADAMTVGSTSAPAYVGLRNPKSWGSLRFGSIAAWGKGGGDNPMGFGYTPTRLMDYAAYTGSTGGQSFGGGRVRNVIYYEAPAMGAFKLDVAYSTAPLADDADHTVATRKGSGWYLAPQFNAGFANFVYVHADVKEEASLRDHKADKFAVQFNVAGFNFAPQYTIFKADLPTGRVADQRKWVLPINYRMGNHHFGVAFAKTGKDKAPTSAGLDYSAKWKGVAYNYNFSKRTTVSANYVKLQNGTHAAYDLAGHTGTASGSIGFTALAGESATVVSVGLHHSF